MTPVHADHGDPRQGTLPGTEAKQDGIDLAAIFQNPTIQRRNLDLANQVVQYVQEGSYCAILGPRYSGKTGVIQAVRSLLTEQLRWPYAYLDLYELEATTQREFFAALANLTADLIAKRTSADFRSFLIDVVTRVGSDLVLILDHLEALPNDLVQALLTSLRAAYMEQQTLDHRLLVVVSGALSLAALTVGESSPFRGIARRVFVSGLSESESEAFIRDQIEADWIRVSDAARYSLMPMRQARSR